MFRATFSASFDHFDAFGKVGKRAPSCHWRRERHILVDASAIGQLVRCFDDLIMSHHNYFSILTRTERERERERQRAGEGGGHVGRLRA